MRFLLACAGTAGHINPAIAIAGELRSCMPDAEILFIGSGRELENRLIPMAGYDIVNISSTGFVRGFKPADIIENCVTVKNLFVGSRQAAGIIKKFRPDAAVGTGGYVCYPVLRTAHRMCVPTVIHESNAVPGLTTEMLSGIVDRVLVAFPGMEDKYKRPERVIYTGTPIRGEFFQNDRQSLKRSLGFDANKPLVVSFWGSLGAHAMNESMCRFILENERAGLFSHVHATGGGEEELSCMTSSLKGLGLTADKLRYTDIRDYIYDMPRVMSAADIVLCRAGASTIGELTATGKPSVLVPSPNVTANHQEKNALRMQEAGCSVMVPEKDAAGERLFNTVRTVLADENRLVEMSAAALRLAVPDSADRIMSAILSLCG